MKTDHKYIVMVLVDFGDEDTIDAEYTGEEHNNFESAQAEMRKADRDPVVSRSWITHTWLENGVLHGEDIYR